MATTIKHEQASVGTAGAGVTPEGAFLTTAWVSPC
jgi:hypothetical protein